MGISGVKPDHRHCLLLPAHRERSRGPRAAEQRDELAARHSITSSARASRVGGTSRPSALARETNDRVEIAQGRSCRFHLPRCQARYKLVREVGTTLPRFSGALQGLQTAARRYGWRQGEAIRYDHTSLGFDGLNDPLRSIIVWVLGPSIRRILKSRISNPT